MTRSPLEPDARQAILVALDQLEGSTLADSEWRDVTRIAEECVDHIRSGEREGLDELTTRLSVAGFHAQVGRRLGGPRRASPMVVPAKRSPVLPVVGAVCAMGIGALGFAIGGGIVAAGTVVLALFVFGVALAGTQAANERRRTHSDDAPDTPVRPPNADELDALRSLRAEVAASD